MRNLRWSFTAGKCGSIALFVSLAFASSGLSQEPLKPILPTPIIGPYAAPLVRIIAPANHATFYSPVDIPIYAYVRDLVGIEALSNVDFYAGTNDLGPGERISIFPPRPFQPGIPAFPAGYGYLGAVAVAQPEYVKVWTNPAPGTYELTVVAKRSVPIALTVTSAPVTITVLPPPPPVTNKLDIVSIVATDPIAISGTNCWVSLGVTNATPSWSNWPPVIWTRITNCGPKSAVFTVRRFGDASNPLTVDYNIGGTASNGLDYVIITNNVTIPAGSAFAQINILPLDDTNVSLLPKTVVLSLTSPLPTPLADYIVGLPSRAEAIIYDGMPRPFPVILPDATFHLSAAGPDGAWFVVQSSTDLQNWTSICTNQVVQGSIDFADPNAGGGSATGFYRAVPQ